MISQAKRISELGSASVLTMTVLRVVVGVVMTAHGFLKLQDISGWQDTVDHLGMPMPALFGLFAIAGEFLGGLGLIVGLLTRIAAFGVACTMAVAIYLVHLPHGLMASNNGFEFPLTLLSVALFFIATGGGPVSLDAWIGRAFHRRRRVEVDMAQERVGAPSAVPVRPAAIDSVEEADLESFPASDPPARAAHSLRDHVRNR